MTFPASSRFRRRGAVAAAALLLAASAAAETVRTYVYKTVGPLEIKADVHLPDGFSGPRPVAVWIHGGALMSGRRQIDANNPIKNAMIADGTVVVSIDYRLAPETKLPELMTDVEDAFRWLRNEGPALFSIDPDRLAVAGSSAGGYLTLSVGHRVKPRPRALVSFWGYGDLIGPWYSEPSKLPRHQKVILPRDEAYRLVSGPPVANAFDRPGQGGANFYLFCRQQGIWPREVSGGWDPKSEPEKFHPYMPLKNVTRDFPPTLLIHGLKDTDVPAENSILMAAELKRHGVEHRLITDPEADHGSNWSPERRAGIERAAADFIRAHLK